MKLREQFTASKQIAEVKLRQGDYRWIPKTSAGWLIRIACTDVGVGAWHQAKTIENKQAISQSSSTQDLAEHPFEKDLAPAPSPVEQE